MPSTTPNETFAPDIDISGPGDAMSRPQEAAEVQPLTGPFRNVFSSVVVLILIGFLIYILQDGIRAAFMTNPGLNGLIVGVLAVGILVCLAEFRRVSKAASRGTRAREQGFPDDTGGLCPEARLLRHCRSGSHVAAAG